MREQTNLNGVKAVAKSLLMIDLHLTDYSPVIVQHPFTSSGMVACPSEDGLRLMDITKSDKDLRAWQEYMKELIDNAKNPYHIYMMLNKPYALAFLNLAESHLSQKDFSEILSDAWIRSENPNMDKNFVKKNLVDMFKKADKSILMDGEEKEQVDSFEDTITIYRGVTSYVIDDDYMTNASTGDYCFVEDKGYSLDRVSEIILCKWNRKYQADVALNIDLKANGFKKVGSEDIKGSSHDKITIETYKKV